MNATDTVLPFRSGKRTPKRSHQELTSDALQADNSPAKPRTSSFTHDLNNCLMSISGFAELILTAGPNDPHLKKYAEKIVRQSQRGFCLVQQLKEEK